MKAQSKYYKISLSGNIRQLRNVAEQISVLETNRDICSHFTILFTVWRQQFTFCDKKKKSDGDFSNEREIV
jgi:DNA-binding NtrC family response regulator